MSNRDDTPAAANTHSQDARQRRRNTPHANPPVNSQQDALRRLTCHRSAASVSSASVAGANANVASTAGAAGAANVASAATAGNGANVDTRREERAVSSISSAVEEEAETVGSMRGLEAPRHQYSQYTQRSSPPVQLPPTTKSTSSEPTGKEGWTILTPAPLSPSLPPCQRSLHAAAVVNDSLYVFGGYDGQNRVNDFYQYHFPTGCWREIVTLGSGVLVGGVHQNQNVVPGVGGTGGNADMGGGANNPNNIGDRPVSRSFGSIAATGTVPTPRDRHAAVVHNSTFYIFGGFDGTSRVSDLYGFDVERLVWRQVHPHVPNVAVGMQGGRRVGFNIVDAGGGVGDGGNRRDNLGQQQQQQAQQQQLVRVGRENGLEVDFHQEPHQQQLQVQQQQQQQPVTGRQHHSPPSPRHSHSAVVYNDSMYVFGGYDGSYRSDFHEFHFVQNSWRPVFSSGRTPRARYRATACVHEDMMILFGGHDGTRHLSDVHTFDFVTQNWSLLMTDGVPPLPRDSHVSVVYKNSMYVFGGSTGSAMNDLHELTFPSSSEENITTDALAAPDYSTVAGSTATFQDEAGEAISIAKWRQIPPVPGGSIAVHRFCHVGAVYNGSFYVFGGYDGQNRLNDFVKYDLALDDLFETTVPPSTLLTDLQSFLHDEGCLSVSDITIMVENIPVRAHKIMLMRCPYFRAMLLSEMAESNQSIISIEIVKHPIFLSVLEYLYTDDVSIPLDSAMELFVAADLFGIPRLQSMCERKLLESISVENAATIFYAADIHSATSLRNKALGYVLSHFEAVSKTSAFEDMARCNVELVFEILKNR